MILVVGVKGVDKIPLMITQLSRRGLGPFSSQWDPMPRGPAFTVFPADTDSLLASGPGEHVAPERNKVVVVDTRRGRAPSHLRELVAGVVPVLPLVLVVVEVGELVPQAGRGVPEGTEGGDP